MAFPVFTEQIFLNQNILLFHKITGDPHFSILDEIVTKHRGKVNFNLGL